MKEVIWSNSTNDRISIFPHVTYLTEEDLDNLNISLGGNVRQIANEWLEQCEGSISVYPAINKFSISFEKESDAVLFKLTLD